MKACLLPLLCIVGLCSFGQNNKAAKPPINLAVLDTAFARIITNWNAAGFAVAVVHKDKVIFAKGYGYKDYENKIPATVNTQFAIGSCTKAFTASIIGMLDNEEKLDIDKPVHNYYPGLKLFNDDMTNHITLRDMMCHRTGLSRYDFSWYFFGTDSQDSLVKRMQYMEPNYGLREKWQYNNFMYMLQGAVAHKLTGKTWEQNVRERILDSLGMGNTSLSIDEMLKAADIAKGYGLENETKISKTDYYYIKAMSPAGSINSSVTDMAKWLTAWINGGKYNGKQVLPPAHVHEAMSQQMTVGDGLPSKLSPDVSMGAYGLGWFLSNYRGHHEVQHGGNIDGFTALATFYPTDSIGIVVLANQNGSQVPGLVNNLIADKLFNLPYKDWNTLAKNQDTTGKAAAKAADATAENTQKLGTKTSHPIADYTGRFAAPGGESIDVTLNKDSLIASTTSFRLWMRHYHYDVFSLYDIKNGVLDTIKFAQQFHTNMKASFLTNEQGDINSISIPLNGPEKPMIFKRRAIAQEVSKDSLQKYVGDYNLMGQPIKIYIKNEKTLFALVPGQPEYELVPIGTDKFTIKVLDGYSLKFDLDDKGAVATLSFIQPNGVFKAERKK